MKRLLLLLAIALCWCVNDALGQTDRIKKAEEDGFVWHKIRENENYGAEDTNGRTIIPTQFSTIYYLKIADGWFCVEDNEKHEGAYEKDGKCIISPDRGYSNVTKLKTYDVYWYSVKKGDLAGACDENGNEIISPDKGYSYVTMLKGGDGYWYKVKSGEMEGVCDANGNEIIAPKYKSLFYSRVDNTFTYKDSNGKYISTGISLKGSTYASTRGSSSSSSGYSGTVQSDSSDGQTDRVKKVEDDGFVWYKIRENGYYGAEDINGRTIIPTQFGLVVYQFTSDGWFTVLDNNKSHGAYEKNGKCVISPDRGYSSVTKQKAGDVYWYSVKKGDMAGACDENGNEIISPDRGYSYVGKRKEGDGYWYSVEKGDMAGACDANGNEIIAPKFKTLFYNYDKTFTYQDSNGKYISTGISLKGSTYASTRGSSSSSSGYSGTVQSDRYNNQSQISQIVEKKIHNDDLITGGGVIEYRYYDIKDKNGKRGIMSLDEKIIIPMLYDMIVFDWFGGGYYVETGNAKGLYTMDGMYIIPLSRGYTEILYNSDDEDDFPEENKYGSYYRVEKGEDNVGICNLLGEEILSPSRGYDEVGMYKSGGIPFIMVSRNEKHGICTIDGKEIIAPVYSELAISNANTFMYKKSSGQYIDLLVRPDGSRYEMTYNTTAKKKKKAWLGVVGKALISGLAVGAAVYAQQAAVPKVPAYTPTTRQPNYSTSTSYYTSPAYLAQVQARANQSMANFQAQLQQIGQQALLNNQQMLNRSKNMFGEMTSWALGFQRDNGREPTDLEKSQWVKQNYPDMYASYVQAQAALYERSSNVSSSSDEPTKSEKEISNTYDCSYCGGSGRLLQEDETLSFGLPTEKEYKCQECGKWKYKGKTHRHYDCSHCKGSGKVTFK